jgi:F-box-like
MAPIFCDRCPGDTQAVVVAEGCGDPLDELAQLDTYLTAKRYDLKRKINRFHSPIVRQLPPDVISTVFEFCLPDFSDYQPFPSKVDLCFPLSLGAICSYWREIAWSTPRLWSSLVVCLKPHTAIVQEWLARSGQLPLSIRILSHPYKLIPRDWRQAISALADIINQYSNRWFDLDLCIPQYFYQFFRAIDNHAPILRSIRFDSSYACDGQKFQLTCPRLERAHLSSSPMDGIDIQWDNLTHLTLDNISFIDSFHVLRRTPRLVFCKISYAQLEIGPSQPLILASLRTLLIPNYCFYEYLNNLITPCLEELSLSSYSNVKMNIIASFFERSACSLRSFSMIFEVSAYLEGFMSLLPLIPSLKTLSITSNFASENDPPSRNILQLVAKVLSSQSKTLRCRRGFLPNLEVLKYTGPQCLRLGSYADLYPLPPADNAIRGPLHLLQFNFHPATHYIPQNIIPYFLSLVERGVTVNVLSGSEDILQSSIDYYRDKEGVPVPGLG